MKVTCLLILFPLVSSVARAAEIAVTPEHALAGYRAVLESCRKEHGGGHDLPDVKFFLFGMGGARTKLLYRDGALIDSSSGRELRHWNVQSEIIVPSDYSVRLETGDKKTVELREDETAVWLKEDGHRTEIAGTHAPVRLPDFADRKYPRVLRVLHQELLVNVTAAGPVPNYFVYRKPWYRDGAMVALALKKTGNIDLLRDWILGLREPFDRNNGGETEADNLGQFLFLVSLVSDSNHSAVARALAEIPRFEIHDAAGKFIRGRSDFGPHPVYQTKWLKFGLRALGLPDPYVVPKLADSYDALFWMDYRDAHTAAGDSDNRGDYPYLGWACDHFHGTKKSPLGNRDYPLTWEAHASQADYAGMTIVSPVFAGQKISAPHTWHAAEAFLSLIEEPAVSNP